MADGGSMDSHIYETYNQRMSEIQDVSDVIAVANMQLNKILTQFNWTKKSLLKKKTLEQCPIDKNHKVLKDNLPSHVPTCSLRKHNIVSAKKKDVSLHSFYDSSSSTVPIFISKAQYEKLGVPAVRSDGKEANSLPENEDDILEADDGINFYKPCNSLDELRFIYSWHKIPKNYIILDIARIPRNELNNWLIANISKIKLDGHLTQCLINSLLVWLNELPTPSQILSYVEDLLGENSRSFILMLWKFLAAKTLCLNQQIPEHTRNEFDFYTSRSMQSQSTSVLCVSNSDKKVTIENLITPLPLQWALSYLNSEQKLSIYNDICKIWYFLKKPGFGIDELKRETHEQEKLLTEFDENDKGFKTHWEVLKELRDYKRRRQSYRGKNKAKRLSALDALRELLNQQMLYLKLTQKNKNVVEDEKIKESEESKHNEEKRERDREEHVDKDRRRSLNRGRDSKRNRSRSKERRRSRSNEVRSRSHSRDWHQSKRDRYHERSRERGSSRRDSRSKDEVRNKTYY